jgi:hypothetical protein
MSVITEPINILVALMCALERPRAIIEKEGEMFIVPPRPPRAQGDRYFPSLIQIARPVQRYTCGVACIASCGSVMARPLVP